MAEILNASAIFNDALKSSSDAVSQINNMYQQAQSTFTSRRDAPPPPAMASSWNQSADTSPWGQQQNPYGGAYPSMNSYGYGYSNGSTGFSYATQQQEAGYPGFANQLYGKQGGF